MEEQLKEIIIDAEDHLCDPNTDEPLPVSDRELLLWQYANRVVAKYDASNPDTVQGYVINSYASTIKILIKTQVEPVINKAA